ncbi:hypothetical protein L1887_22218 [Cichorium endivia]|nr:hypothetical protein L1887_22218 [Cichorium endivia]
MKGMVDVGRSKSTVVVLPNDVHSLPNFGLPCPSITLVELLNVVDEMSSGERKKKPNFTLVLLEVVIGVGNGSGGGNFAGSEKAL